jgi:hypothetical protein
LPSLDERFGHLDALWPHSGFGPAFRSAYGDRNSTVPELDTTADVRPGIVRPPERTTQGEDIQDFEYDFRGTTTEPVELQKLIATHDQMTSELQNDLETDERRFLLSLTTNKPEWALLDIAHAERLPGIQWKKISKGFKTPTQRNSTNSRRR